MQRTLCGKAVCPNICTRGAHCAAGQQRSQVAFANYAVKLAQRRLARLQSQQLPLVIPGESIC